MAEYVPTLTQVREFIEAAERVVAHRFQPETSALGAFNRWLEALKRAEREAAWNEGYWLGINGHTGPGNPYAERTERGES